MSVPPDLAKSTGTQTTRVLPARCILIKEQRAKTNTTSRVLWATSSLPSARAVPPDELFAGHPPDSEGKKVDGSGRGQKLIDYIDAVRRHLLADRQRPSRWACTRPRSYYDETRRVRTAPAGFCRAPGACTSAVLKAGLWSRIHGSRWVTCGDKESLGSSGCTGASDRW